MAAIQDGTKGHNFTSEELLGRQIRIEGPYRDKKHLVPTGMNMMIIADDEQVENACKLELMIEPDSIVEAKITLYRLDLPDAPQETITLRDDISVSFSAIVSEVS